MDQGSDSKLGCPAAVRDAGGTVLPDGRGISIRGWSIQATKAPILSTFLDLARQNLFELK